MQMARAAGIPTPRVLSCREHPGDFRKVSILMTRLTGVTLVNSDDPLEVEVEEPWLHELKVCVDAMRMWTPPSQDLVCSPIGTELRSSRVPDHVMGPFDNHKGLYDHLFYPVSSDHAFKSEVNFQKTLETANRLRRHSYTTKFTHGDFKAHNIVVSDDGHLAGVLD